MKKKYILDIIMIIIMTLLINKFFTGVLIHEILWLIVLILFAYHIFLNKNWIIKISNKIINEFSKINKRIKIMYFLDIIVFILMVLSIISGILISQVLFNFSIDSKLYLTGWHHFFLYWLTLILLIHIGFHWNIIRTKLKIKKASFKDILLILIWLCIVIYIFVKNDAFKKILIPQKEEYVIIEDKDKIDDKIDNNHNQKDDNGDYKNDDSSGNDKPSLSEYLSKFTCNGCGRHCLLSNPRCGREIQQQNIKINEYNERYSSSK